MPTKSNNIGGKGGARNGAGRKPKPAIDKLAEGNGKTIKVLDIPDTEGVEMPEPHEFLSAKQ